MPTQDKSGEELARRLMEDFLVETGVVGNGEPGRYLWTDAFAVCNCLDLARRTGDPVHLQHARMLVHQVHDVLGKYRLDDSRQGWISGLAGEQGELHPTRGGLRIGKPLAERSPNQPFDSQLEWSRDGQYFHYLTKWIHALFRASLDLREPTFLSWAADLAIVAHKAFCYQTGPKSRKRMYWKMSIDLRRPLVPSMGHHDPLEGLAGCLEMLSRPELDSDSRSDLAIVATDYAEMCRESHWTTEDPLGAGGLLDTARRLVNLGCHFEDAWRPLLSRLLMDAKASLDLICTENRFSQPAELRLAFRELGLSIGLNGLDSLTACLEDDPELFQGARLLQPLRTLGKQITGFWTNPVTWRTRSWMEHREINSVMLATSLLIAD